MMERFIENIPAEIEIVKDKPAEETKKEEDADLYNITNFSI